MKKCLITSSGKPSLFMVIVLLTIFLTYIWITVTEMLGTVGFPIFITFSILWLGALAAYVIHIIIWCRSYEISKDGITISDRTGFKHFYRWESFHDISICNVHYTSRPPYEHDVVIRLSLLEEPMGPKSGVWGQWTTALYEIIHFRRIFILTNTEERHLEFARLCSQKIEDRRDIRKNAFDME